MEKAKPKASKRRLVRGSCAAAACSAGARHQISGHQQIRVDAQTFVGELASPLEYRRLHKMPTAATQQLPLNVAVPTTASESVVAPLSLDSIRTKSVRRAVDQLAVPAQPRKEALEVKLKPATPKDSSKRKSNTRREALEVKLTRAEAAPRAPEQVRREALEIQLQSVTNRKTGEFGDVSGNEEKEGLAKLEQLRKVEPITPRQSSAQALRKRASSLLAVGGLKPSLLKNKRRGGGDGAEGGGGSFEGFVHAAHDAHAQLKQALAAQQAELERLEAEMEREREEEEARRAAVADRQVCARTRRRERVATTARAGGGVWGGRGCDRRGC